MGGEWSDGSVLRIAQRTEAAGWVGGGGACHKVTLGGKLDSF